jgi:hypothetical protein
MLETDEACVGQQRARNAEFAGPGSDVHHGSNPEFGEPFRGSFHDAERRPVLLRHVAEVLRKEAIERTIPGTRIGSQSCGDAAGGFA